MFVLSVVNNHLGLPPLRPHLPAWSAQAPPAGAAGAKVCYLKGEKARHMQRISSNAVSMTEAVAYNDFTMCHPVLLHSQC